MALADVGDALRDLGHDAVHRLRQTDLATQTRSVGRKVLLSLKQLETVQQNPQKHILAVRKESKDSLPRTWIYKVIE